MKTIYTGLLILFAHAVFAQALLKKEVTFTCTNESLSEALNDLASTYQFDIYGTEKIPNDISCQIVLEQENLAFVLQELLKSTEFGYMEFGDQAIIIAEKKVLKEQWNPEAFAARNQVQQTQEQQKQVYFIGDSQAKVSRQAQRITGRIKDAVTGEVLFGTTVYEPQSGKGAATDAEGNFTIELSPGLYELKIQSIGYEDLPVAVRVFTEGELELELTPTGYQLDAVTVSEQATDANVRDVNIGLQTLTTEKIKSLPSFLGEADVIKSLLTLPGVSTVGEGARGLNVRGGTIDQNLIMQDGAPVFNSSHVLGFFSIFNPDVVRSVDLYKGNIPAQYGGRLSSVLSVDIKNADTKTFKMRGGVGPVSNKLTLELPLIKEKTSLLIGGRSSESDWILRRINNSTVKNSSASFYDFTAKVSHRFSKGSNIDASVYQSRDRFVFGGRFGYAWGTRMATLRYNQLFNDKISGNIRAAVGELNNEFFQPSGQRGFTLTNGLSYYKVKPSFFFNNFAKHKIIAGSSWIRYLGQEEALTGFDEESDVTPDAIQRDSGEEFAFFINDEWKVNERISISAGLRYSAYRQLGTTRVTEYAEGQLVSPENAIGFTDYSKNELVQTYDGLEPRIAAVLRLGEEKSLKVSYNRSNQYIHLVSNTTVPTPVDIWQVSTSYIPPQRAHNFSIGYFQNFRNNDWESSFEAYYRSIESLVEYRDFAELLLNSTPETELLTGRGRAYGTELFLRKNTGKVNGQISYTFARSLRQSQSEFFEQTINEGRWFPSPFDQPHSVKCTFNWKPGKRSDISLNFVYNTGRPVTAPYTQYYLGSLIVPQYSERNQFRIPDYHRLDFAWTFRPRALRRKKYKDSITLTVYNLYARNNAFSVFFERADAATTQAFQLSILASAFPAITYNFELN